MAQTGYTPILIYASGTTGNTPSASNLTSSSAGAELALNYFDGKLFYKDASGVVQVLAGKGGSGIVAGSNTQVQFNNNGAFGASSGMTWDGTNLTATQLRSSGLTSGRVTYASTSGLLVDSANMTFNGTRLTVADFADSGLTSGRVTYATTGGNLTDSANLTFDGTTLTAANFADSSLTSGRVTFAGSGGNLNDAAGLTWDGTNLTATQLRSSGLTSGRVTFAGASGLLSDSANLTWNGTTLAITGALTATADSTFSSTGALTISKGTTAERPTPVSGMLRFNTQTSEFEGYNGTTWSSVGGAGLSNDTSTTSNVFPLFANATSGTASTLFTSNAKLLYKPSTGEFQSSAVVASNGIFVNSQTVTANYTVPSGSNAMSSGPVTVADGITVTVSDGSVWTVI